MTGPARTLRVTASPATAQPDETPRVVAAGTTIPTRHHIHVGRTGTTDIEGRRTIEVVAHVVGTDEDPQGLAGQEAKLRRAGARVCPTNRLAAELARDLVRGRRGR